MRGFSVIHTKVFKILFKAITNWRTNRRFIGNRQMLKNNKIVHWTMSEFPERFTEKDFSLNVLPKVWLNSSPEESAKISISLDLDLPSSAEWSPVKKSREKILRSLLRMYKSKGVVSGLSSLDKMRRVMAKNLSEKRGTALCGCTRAWACSSRIHCK